MDEETIRKNKEKNEALLDKIMINMRRKNYELRRRHAEVERDRIEAEAHGSSITTTQSVQSSRAKVEAKLLRMKQEREWDKGKRTEGDQEIEEQGACSRYPGVPGSSFKPQDYDKGYNLRRNTQGGFQESRQFGSSFQKGNRKLTSYKYPQNWRSEQRKSLDPEESPKEQEDSDRLWYDNEDDEESQTKQSRVENWLDTLKNVKEWENKNPSNTFKDQGDQSAKYKAKPKWDDNTNDQALPKKTGRNEQKKQKFKSQRGQPSTNVQELEHHSKMLELKKNFANLDLSVPGNQPHTYQQQPKISKLENISDKEVKIDHSEFDKERRVSGDYKTPNWDDDTNEQALPKKTGRCEQKQKFKSLAQPSTNVREVESSSKMLKVKKTYGSMDVTKPRIQPPRKAKISRFENTSTKLSGDFESDIIKRRARIDCEDDTNRNTSNKNVRSANVEQRKCDNQDYVRPMETVTRKFADQKPNYPRGRGRGRGFSSNLNTDKIQKNSGQREVVSKPTTRRNDNQNNMNQRKFPSRSCNNNKATYQARRSEMRKSEEKRSDQETRDLKFKQQKPSNQRRKSRYFEDDNKTKVPVKERESEGIWSELDTEETLLAYEMSLKKEQEESNGMYSDSEDDVEGQKIIGELSVENLCEFNNPKKKQKKRKSKKTVSVETIHKKQDSKLTTSSDENNHVMHSIDDTSPIVNIENTTYTVCEPKIKISSKSHGELNQTYTIEKPKFLSGLPIDEGKTESMPESEEDSPEKLSALKKSKKDYKDKDNDK